MIKRMGSFIVLFRPGVVSGIHNEKEAVVKDICLRFGEFDNKVFDPYLVYSEMADEGLLDRVEQVNAYGCGAVSFFYPAGCNESAVRRKIINRMLGEVISAPVLIKSGCAVVCDSSGDLRLAKPGNCRQENKDGLMGMSRPIKKNRGF